MLHNTPAMPMESITGPSAGFLCKHTCQNSTEFLLKVYDICIIHSTFSLFQHLFLQMHLLVQGTHFPIKFKRAGAAFNGVHFVRPRLFSDTMNSEAPMEIPVFAANAVVERLLH